jgi:hypothetical protein
MYELRAFHRMESTTPFCGIKSVNRGRSIESKGISCIRYEYQMCQPPKLSKIKRANYKRYAESNVSATDTTKLKYVDCRCYVKWNMSTAPVT